MATPQYNKVDLGFDQIHEAASVVKNLLELNTRTNKPLIGLVLGSGLGGFANQIPKTKAQKSVSYDAIPNFPSSTIEGHRGEMHYGEISDCGVLVMQGRVHLYEGYDPKAVVFPVRVMAALGVKSIILTNAAGAINTSFAVGDLMLISDHINMTGTNPLMGRNDQRLGARFTDMTNAYSPRLRELAQEVASSQNLQLREGCYYGVSGPTYETPAEIKMMRTCGADAVGMSTVFETIAARHSGVDVLGISCLTNMAAGIDKASLDHADVTLTANQAESKFTNLLFALIPKMAKLV